MLAGGAYIGWYRLSGEGKLPAETIAPVPARLAPLAEQALPGPDGRVPVPAPPSMPERTGDDQFEPRSAAVENPLLAPEPAPPPPPVEAVRIAPIPGATATTAIAMPVHPPIRYPDSPPEAAAPASDGAANSEATRVTLRFTGDTWVQVKERGGQVLVAKVMKAGETFAVPARPNLVLNTGNAGRVEVLVDGNQVPAIGGSGAVRKDVPMDPEQLKAGYAVPAAATRR